MSSPYVVSTQWLAERLHAPDIAVIDASWHLPAAKRDARAEFLAARIPGAQFFDIDEISDSATPLPHMLPRPEKFSSRMKRLGIGDGKKVTSNGQLIEAIATCARNAGREIASPAEARQIFGTRH